MMHDLHLLLTSSLIGVGLASGGVALLALSAVRYGRRHEARTRKRGTTI